MTMNLRSLTDDVLTREINTLKVKLAPYKKEQGRRKREARQAKRPRQVKVKARKVKSAGERERAAAYVAFRELHERCWNCGRSERDRPADYAGVFIIERAHITHPGLGRRCLDVRLVAALCTLCHLDVHSGKGLTVAELLWLKRHFTPEQFDLEFLQLNSIRRLPEPAKPKAFRESRERFGR